MSLNLAEIFLQGPEFDYQRILKPWAPLLSEGLQPIGMSAFGDVYFRGEDGDIHVLDVLEGDVHMAAASQEAFEADLQSEKWQAAYLMPDIVWQIKARGLIRGHGQVFGFAPHPAVGGDISPETAVVLDAVAWHRICSTLLFPKA